MYSVQHQGLTSHSGRRGNTSPIFSTFDASACMDKIHKTSCIDDRPHLPLSAGGLADEAALYQRLSHAALLVLHRRRDQYNREAGGRELVIDLHPVHGQPHAREAAVRSDASRILQGEACGCSHQNFLGGVVYHAYLNCSNGHSNIDCVAEAFVC